MTKIQSTFGSRDGAFYQGHMPIATQVPRAHVGQTLSAAFLAHYQIAPDAEADDAVHAAITLADGATTTVTTAITNPDVPRTVKITGSQAGITGNVVITGTNYAGVEITDTIAANGDATVEGVKAFRTITQIVVPARNGAGDTIAIGVGKKLGLPNIVAYASCLVVKLFNGSADAGTLTVDADELEKNLFALAGTPDGSKLVDLYYLI